MVKAEFIIRERPRIFFSYSYHEKNLKDIFREAANESDVIPIIADEHIQVGDSIVEKIQQLLSSSDLVVLHLSNESSWVFREFNFTHFLNKPMFILCSIKNSPLILPDFKKYKINYYEDEKNLKTILVNYLMEFKNNFIKKDVQKIVSKEDNLMEYIKKSIQTNVLILGKDSDEEGLKKISRIKKAIKYNGYKPLIIRELPDIEEISFEGKMTRVASHCRFIIVEDSRSSGHIDELKICTISQFITGSLKQVGKVSTWMQAHYPLEYNFMQRFCYLDKSPKVVDKLCDKEFDTLELAIDAAIKWAEQTIEIRKKNYKEVLYS